MSISVLIVGLGQIGMGYDLHFDTVKHIYSHARAFSQHPEFHLIAAVDPDYQKQKTFTQNYSCPAYANVEAALESHQPELIVLAVPTHLHAETLHQVLECSHPKVILCEKPLSYKLNEAQDMVNACAINKVKLFVNYMRCSDPGVIELKKRIKMNEISSPVKGVVWYSKGLIHNGSHFFNLMELWFGQVKSFNVCNRGRLWDESDPEPDLQVTFDGADILFLAAWEESFSHYTIELLSPSGRLRYEKGGELIEWQTTQSDPHIQGYTALSSTPENIYSDMKRYQWHVAEQLARELESKESHLCSGETALNTLKNIKIILEKINNGI